MVSCFCAPAIRNKWRDHLPVRFATLVASPDLYTATRNKCTAPEKIEMKKYDPKARKHVMYTETKLK